MKLGFIVYKYFPYGGLQRDMLRIAECCRDQGHQVQVFTMHWEGPQVQDIAVQVLDIRRLSRHSRDRAFHAALQSRLREQRIDRVVGFNKMPGLDFYYAADPCLRDKLQHQRSRLTRQLPRYRHYLAYEEAVFGTRAHTSILMIAPRQQEIYRHYYQTQPQRMHMLPPGISRDRMAGDDAGAIRAGLRRELGLAEDDRLILCIGSGFRTKGLDRSLKAFAALPAELARRSRLVVIGSDNGRPFQRLARRLGVQDRFTLLGGRDDVPRFLFGGDLLLHPAYYENTGTLLLEAMVAGLPVLTTANCGYAFYVEAAAAGQVLPMPFSQQALNSRLAEMLVSAERQAWSENGIRFGRTEDLYSMPEAASRLILQETHGDDLA